MYRKNNNVYLPSFEKHNKESKVKLMIKKTCLCTVSPESSFFITKNRLTAFIQAVNCFVFKLLSQI